MKNSEEQVDRFLRLLRETPVDSSINELGFETRLMAKIHEDMSNSLSRWAWLLLPYFATGALILSFWVIQTASTTQTKRSEALVAEVASAGHDDFYLQDQ